MQRSETWDETRELIRGRVAVVTDRVEQAELDGRPMVRIRFRRVYDKSTHRYQNMLKGLPFTD